MATTPWTGAPAAPIAAPPGLQVERPADGRVLLAALAAGVGLDVALQHEVASLGGVAGMLLACGGVLASGRLAGRWSRALVLVAAALVPVAALRWHPAAILPALAAAIGLVVLAGSLARGGSPFDLTLPAAAGRGALTVVHGFLAPAFLGRPLAAATASRRGAAVPVLRGLALALPVVLALTALLASADAVFARFLRPPDDLADVVGHLVIAVVGACAAGAVLRHASARLVALPLGPSPRLGAVEARVLLAGVAGVHAAFSVAQLVAATEGGRRVLQQEGLTYAEHARSGFWQLLVAAALTAAVLGAVRACADPGDRAATALGLVAIALTEVVVGVALQRLALYERAYGLTLLRLAAVFAAAWIGVAFLLVGAAWAGVGRGRAWLFGALGASALVVIAGWAVVDPAALVARRSIDAGKVDPAYLAGLGDDAVPTVLARVGRLPADQEAAVKAEVCPTPGERGVALASNRAAARAQAARRAAC